MGRRTYEFGLELGVTNPYPAMRQYVISRSMAASPDPAVELIREGPAALVSPAALELVSSTTYRSGVVVLRYRVRR
jgi:dihydrofolate reductase